MTPFDTPSMDSGGKNPDRTKRPGPQKMIPPRLPPIQKATLSNGLAIWLMEKHTVPAVSMSLVLPAGADRDPRDMPGLASMTGELVKSGTSTLTALDVAHAHESVGSSLHIRTSYDGSFGTVWSLGRHFPDMTALLAAVATDPAFPAGEVERVRSTRLVSLLQQKDRPSAIAMRAFSRIIYGPEHPYGSDPFGTEKSLNAIRREELREFHGRHYRPSGSTLIVVGDVDMPFLMDAVEREFGQWSSGAVPAAMMAQPHPAEQRRVYLIDKPGAPQSEIRIGRPGLARNTPDFFPALVMNRVLGGQFSSRLNLNLRERQGLTYGAWSSFSFTREPGPFTAGAAVAAGKTGTAVREFLREMEKMQETGLSMEELAFSKMGLTGNFALNFETNVQIAAALQNLVLYGLPDRYYDSYLQNIATVTRDDVQRVSRAILDTSKMVIVIAGDVSLLRGPLEEMGVGAVLLCDHDGNPL